MVWFVCDDCGDTIKKVTPRTDFFYRYLAMQRPLNRRLNLPVHVPAAKGSSAFATVLRLSLHLPGLQSQLRPAHCQGMQVGANTQDCHIARNVKAQADTAALLSRDMPPV